MRYLPIDKLTSGMVVARDVYNASKQLLLKEFSIVEPKFVQQLKTHKVEAVCIYDEADLVGVHLTPAQKEEMKELIRPRKKIIFKFCYGDFMMNALFDAVVANEVGAMWNERAHAGKR